MTAATGLILLSGGCVIGWSLRWQQVDRLERRVDELLGDLDCAVRDLAAMLTKPRHPAGKNLPASVTPLRQVKP